jgi:hypothetical protein
MGANRQSSFPQSSMTQCGDRQSNAAIPDRRIINESSIVIPQSSMDVEHPGADNAACSRS